MYWMQEKESHLEAFCFLSDNSVIKYMGSLYKALGSKLSTAFSKLC